MEDNTKIIDFILRLADNSLILGHRISEWCGHGPNLETDIALTNIALDLIGHARNYYELAAECKGDGSTEDDFAYLRDARSFKNVLLVELPKGDFGFTIVRQFLFDVYNFEYISQLCQSKEWGRITIIHRRELDLKTFHTSLDRGLSELTEDEKNKVVQHVVNLDELKSEANIKLFADHDICFCMLGLLNDKRQMINDKCFSTNLNKGPLKPMGDGIFLGR